MRALFLAILAVFLCISQADARRYHHHHKERYVQSQEVSWFSASPWQTTTNSFGGFQAPLTSTSLKERLQRTSGRIVQMLAHPSGCPSRAFCGCGAAVAVFGTPRRDLWLAAAWFKFPRTHPSSGSVAVRPGHVFVLRQQVSGDMWLVEDYNSGGHASRLHERSIRGYTIVNPRG